MRITLIGAVSILIAAVLLSLMLSRVLSSPIHDLIVAMQSFEKSGEGFSLRTRHRCPGGGEPVGVL